jgi:hypothetical protein
VFLAATVSWNKVLEKLDVAHLVKEFSASFETDSAYKTTLLVRILIEMNVSNFKFCLKSILILSSNPHPTFLRWSSFLSKLRNQCLSLKPTELFLGNLASFREYLQKAERESVTYAGGANPSPVLVTEHVV